MFGVATVVVAACCAALQPEAAPRQALHVYAKTGDRVPLLPEGTTFVDFSAPAVNGAGQMVFSAITMRPGEGAGADQLGFGVFRIEPSGAWARVLHLDVTPAAGSRQWAMHEDAECAVNERGQVAAIGFGPGVPPVYLPVPGEAIWMLGGPRPRSGQIVFGPAKGSTGHVPIVKEGDGAPGVEGDHVFHWFDLLSIDPEGTVYFRAGTAPRGARLRGTLDATLSFWRAEPGERPRPLLLSGERAPGCEEGECVRFGIAKSWRPGGVLLEGDIIAQGAQPGDPSRSATWLWSPKEGLKLLARRGDPMPGLEPGMRVGFAVAVDVDEGGNVLFFGEPEREASGRLLWGENRTAAWLRRADGTWRKIVEPGDAVSDDGARKIVDRVHSAVWALGGALVWMTVRDEDAPRSEFSHGGYWLFADGAAPRRVLPDALHPEGIDWPGIVFRPGSAFDVGPEGDVALGIGYGREKESGRPDRPRLAGIWLLTRDARQRCVHLDGLTLDYAPGKKGVVERTSERWDSAVTGSGHVAFKLHFQDGTKAVVRSADPPGR